MFRAEHMPEINKHLAKMGHGSESWKDQHRNAWHGIGVPPKGHGSKRQERAIADLYQAIEAYATAHRDAFASDIGEDGVLGEGWKQILQGTRVLLNGSCGRLDCGTLDGLLFTLAKAYQLENWED